MKREENQEQMSPDEGRGEEKEDEEEEERRRRRKKNGAEVNEQLKFRVGQDGAAGEINRKEKMSKETTTVPKKKMGETSVPAQEIPNKRRKETNKQQSDAASKMFARPNTLEAQKKKENNKEPTDDTKSNRQPEMKRWSAAIFARQNKRESSRQNDEQTNEDAPVRVLFCLFFSFFFSKKKFRPRFGAAAA